MIKQRKLLVIICGFVLAAALALWPGQWSTPAYANVTLVSFTATSQSGQPEIFIEWETATEFDTVGFFIGRSDSSTGTFTRVSDFIPHEGDTVVGAQYVFVDENTALNQTYFYRLEVINTDQSVDYHGPIAAVAGVEATDTPTPSRTPTATATPIRTPTFTPSPTATPTTQPNTQVTNPTAPANGGSVATPRIVTGATVTPQPTASGGSSSPGVPAAPPTVSSGADGSQPSAPDATSVASVPAESAAATAAPPPGADVAQLPAPTFAPPDAVPAIVAPVVIATEAAPSSAPTNSTNASAFILIAAAVLFLGVALVIFRQARQ